MRKYPLAPQRDVKSIRNWHFNYDYKAIGEDEQQYLNYDEDLICLAPRDKTPIRQLIDRSRWLRTLWIWRRRDRNSPEDNLSRVSYYSDKRMDQFSSVFIVLIGVGMLITPIWVLQLLHSFWEKLVVITVFVSVFLIVLSFAMATRPFEALAATAG